ncbi:ROK family transcriptional regulator [Sphingomonas sp. SORGH_AS_0879]|uniref:ROK family transcriptional regulator n=1 Tax=Sphingomonas sp. SORGH_AS_0879 TaxID=3041790 RepID=UPI0027862951|nr:ROK family transcriptional regulator [Sphingomonas sp. SORGH_AS_0879]MDQ1231131.1 putative NBD/HSP70 family sugar kinase [Sphingomonas sp. SORGH_AS_0879]
MRYPSLTLLDEEKRLLWQLRTHGAQSRSTLAATLQISNSAVTRLTKALAAQGLLEEMPSEALPARGRPTVPLRISAAGGYAFGLALYAGILEIAVVDYAGGVIALTSEAIELTDPAGFARHVDRRIHELTLEHRLLGRRLYGVGFSAPGPALSRDGNRWSIVRNLPGWKDAPLRDIFAETLQLPIWIENDATAAALAEYYLGGLIGRCTTAIVILLGHGVGAGIIHEGRLMRGEAGGAGEIGMFYPGDRPRPTTLDLIATLQAAGCGVDSLANFADAIPGYEAVIDRWLERAADQLLQTVNSAIAWLEPGAIRLMSPLPTPIMQGLVERLNRRDIIWGDHSVESDIGRYTVEMSLLGGAGAALGAALLPIHATITRN